MVDDSFTSNGPNGLITFISAPLSMIDSLQYFHKLMEDNPIQQQPNQSDLKMTPLFSQSLFYDIYKITLGEIVYVAKVFPPARINNYQREKQILMSLDHQNIARPLAPEHALTVKLTNTLKTELLIFPEAARGSFFQYLNTYGSLSESAARLYTRQIVQALTHAQSNGILHPNLHTQNLLLSQDRKVLLCGWSNSLGSENPTPRDLLFAVGELIITLLTSRRPFLSKDSKSDPFAKFLTEAHIHKFWEQIEKIMRKVNKQFQFSSEIKELVSALFLNRIDSLEVVAQSTWAQRQVNEGEIFLEMEEKEKNALQTRETRKAKAQATQKQEKQIVKSNFSMNLNRKPSRSYDIFQEEYENCEEKPSFIEERSQSDQQTYFRLFDQNPRLVISHLRTRLREAERDQQILVDPLLLLKDFDVSLEKGMLAINCTFGWNFAELQDNISLCGYSYQVEMKLVRGGEELLGRLEMQEASELNTGCVSRMNHWLIDNLSPI